ncbi:B12-binding domain-containing radical SAM protein [Tissierella sp. Yu-01]|uniref:B12-binding domain-containing radical SAM protein n=1 Tax=Tissierella sp. Yu-01 TaxID=3035694 RepID=UPI00240E754F|nr:B12-binding domain-containing radical SAM protein [Tissierella sp. Yu-01]WFA09872.1 B12-binding domain-containing radical SAM protein [Tissierella sp. Yu-01]
MKVILSTLNSKYIHTNLAIRYLKEYVKDIMPIETYEFTINQSIDSIVSELYKKSPDLIGFSTYIWNIEQTLKISNIIKILRPNTKILLGGPEVSFDGVKLLEEHPFIDYIIYGEGEETFKDLIHGKDLKDIEGLIFRDDEINIIMNPPRLLIHDLGKIPSPYENIGDEFKNKIVYYESSRGCPFNCKFCLSSTINGVRYFPIERVKKDIYNLIQVGVSQVKFVDRTFNANKKYSMEIMDYIMKLNPENINFHFEVTAHLIEEDTLDFLRKPKEGLFQFEVGVQSTNLDTIDSIGRVTDFEKLKKVTKQIRSYKNIHQHLDLIAGLPYEDYNSFKNSFNDVYSIRPEKLQLGFLKLLKGSELRINEEIYGFKYLDEPPYEILENKYISYSDILKLKGIEDLVEKYYNEGYFTHSVEFIISNFYESPFDFYEAFSEYWDSTDLNKVSHSRNDLYQILLDFYLYKSFDHTDSFKELLKYDYIYNNKKITLPKGIDRIKSITQTELHRLLKSDDLLGNYLKEEAGIPTKKLIKNVIAEGFNKDIFEIINNSYLPSDDNKEIYILFYYKDKVINRCKTINITKMI